MGIFWEKKHEKKERLLKEIDSLNKKYDSIKGKYCKVYNYIFIFKGLILNEDGNEILVRLIDKDTLLNHESLYSIEKFNLKYDDSNFQNFRNNFLRTVKEFNDIGLEIIIKK